MLAEIVAAVLVILVGFALYDFLQRNGSNAPGPYGLPLVGQLFDAHKILGRVDDYLDDLRIKYGPTYMVKAPSVPPFIVTVDPANVEHILKIKFSNYEKGPFFRDNLVDVLGFGIFNVDGDRWRVQRKITSNMFNVSNFQNGMTRVFRFHLVEMGHLLDEAVGKTVDMHDLFHRFTLDSICAIAFGKNLNSLRGRKSPFVIAWDTTNETVIYRFLLFPFLRQFFIAEDQVAYKVRVLREFAGSIVRERREEIVAQQEACTLDEGERADLLSLYLARRDEDGQPFSDEYLIDLVLNMIIAGRDTTAQSLSWTLLFLLTHPRVLAKLREEIDRTLNGSLPDYGSLQQMKYMQAVIHESLRLYPSVPRDFKQAVEADVLPDGTTVPKGALVLYFPYGMGRTESIWGPNAREFYPERFINASGEFVKPSPFQYPVFQAGPRTCLGQNMAILEESMAFCYLLQRYEFDLVPGQRFEIAFNLTAPMKYGLKVIVRKREGPNVPPVEDVAVSH